MDALGSNIRVDARGKEVMRILPRMNELVNEEWISDKTRHCVDGLGVQRLDRPYMRVLGRLRETTWQEAFAAIAARVRASPANRIGAIAGDLASVEEMFALKLLMQSLGSHNIDCRQDGAALDPDARPRAATSSTPPSPASSPPTRFSSSARTRARKRPVLNARIRKRWRLGGFPIGVIGEQRRPHLLPTTISAPARIRSSRLIAGEGEFFSRR